MPLRAFIITMEDGEGALLFALSRADAEMIACDVLGCDLDDITVRRAPCVDRLCTGHSPYFCHDVEVLRVAGFEIENYA